MEKKMKMQKARRSAPGLPSGHVHGKAHEREGRWPSLRGAERVQENTEHDTKHLGQQALGNSGF